MGGGEIKVDFQEEKKGTKISCNTWPDTLPNLKDQSEEKKEEKKRSLLESTGFFQSMGGFLKSSLFFFFGSAPSDR